GGRPGRQRQAAGYRALGNRTMAEGDSLEGGPDARTSAGTGARRTPASQPHLSDGVTVGARTHAPDRGSSVRTARRLPRGRWGAGRVGPALRRVLTRQRAGGDPRGP